MAYVSRFSGILRKANDLSVLSRNLAAAAQTNRSPNVEFTKVSVNNFTQKLNNLFSNLKTF